MFIPNLGKMKIRFLYVVKFKFGGNVVLTVTTTVM
jgi:hypothetical protein